MVTISLCMIVKNEEKLLARCLDSVRAACDEIVIADTGSDDRTKEIAARYTDRVFDFAWTDDFSAARNFSFGLAAMDYQLWLDADDVLPPEELEKLLTLKGSLTPDIDMVTMKYHTHFDENDLPVMTATRERLTRRERCYTWLDPVHECIPLTGNILNSDIAVWHRKPPSDAVSTRNLDIYERLEASGGPLTPRQQYYFARELKDHGRFAKAAYYFERFLRGGEGWVEDNIAACFNLALCYRELGEEDRALSALLQSFSYDSPRAENCCEIGYRYMRRGDYKTALGWFRMAANLEPAESLGFVLRDYCGYIPNIESCVCCHALGDREKARFYNALAKVFKPKSEAVAHNELYLND